MLGGKYCNTFGVCPSSINIEFDGVNHGKNGGGIVGELQGHYVVAKFRELCIKREFLH